MIRSWFMRWCARYGNIGVSDCFDLAQGSNRIDSFWLAKLNEKSQKDSDSRIMIHLRIKIKSNQKSKVGESWHSLIC